MYSQALADYMEMCELWLLHVIVGLVLLVFT